MSQVTSVSQLSDVQPTDWAFQALQSLVERYGCIAGYPDGTYRGSRPLTRYEFAAGLNACMDRVNELIAAATADLVTKEDLSTLQRLQTEFAAELATLRGRVDSLEARTAELEANQFSTTTRFGGEVIFGLSAAGGGKPPGTGNANVLFTSLARIGLVSSFTGKDRLRTVLAAGNFGDLGYANPESLNTYAALFSYQGGTRNGVILDSLEYRFPVLNDRMVLTFRPVGFSLSDVLTANSGYYDTGRGALSRFGEANPIFKMGALDAGFGFDWLIANPIRLQVAYGTRNSNLASGGGIAGADHSAVGVQLLVNPVDTVVAGLGYINAYNRDGRLDTFTGSFNADTSGLFLEPAKTDAVFGSLQWRISRNLTFGAWGGLTFTNSLISNSYANTSNYLVSLGYSDPFNRRGDLLAVLVGQPPKLTEGRGLRLGGVDTATAMHYELFYRFLVNDNISITPGVFIVTNPGSRSENNTIYVGTVRTTFRF